MKMNLEANLEALLEQLQEDQLCFGNFFGGHDVAVSE
jgi:hypothetical protein